MTVKPEKGRPTTLFSQNLKPETAITAEHRYRAANKREDRTWQNMNKRASTCVRQLAVEIKQGLEQAFLREKVGSNSDTKQTDPRGVLSPGSTLKSDMKTKMAHRNLREVSYCEDKSKYTAFSFGETCLKSNILPRVLDKLCLLLLCYYFENTLSVNFCPT